MSDWVLRGVTGEPIKNVQRALFHEHIRFALPGYELDPLRADLGDVDGFATRIGRELSPHGINTLVDATPIGCGRDFHLLARVGERSGLQIVAATGLYHAKSGYPPHFVTLSAEQLAEIFCLELASWKRGEPGPSVIKVATQHPPIPAREERAVRAAGLAAAATGARVVCHSESLAAARVQLALLTESGVDPFHIVLGHLDGRDLKTTDLIELIDAGAWVGLDRFGRMEFGPDEHRLMMIQELAGKDMLGRILISHDSVQSYGGRGTLAETTEYNHALHFHLAIRPALLARGLSPAQVYQLESANFGEFFSVPTLEKTIDEVCE